MTVLRKCMRLPRRHIFGWICHPSGLPQTRTIIGVFVRAAGVRIIDLRHALLHGAGNGLLTIARGTLPLAIFGPENYGYRLGLLGAPSRVCQALAPLGFSLLIDPLGGGVVVVSSILSLVAFGALLLIPMAKDTAGAAAEEAVEGATRP